MIKEMVASANAAQKVLAGFNQEQIDAIVRSIAKYVYDHADPLAKLAAEETQMGVYEHKIQKNRGKARILWHALKDKKSVGVLRVISEQGIVEVAKPMGVIAAVTPCTNPIVTPMCNAMFAVKGGNAVIVSPHPRAKQCAARLNDAFRAILKDHRAPEDVYQTIPEPSIPLTNELMAACDVVIATGGMGMVKSAYSSGKPSFGVGVGNVQCIFDRDIDVPAAVEKAVQGRLFDNGIICSGEQTIIAPRECYDDIISAFRRYGAYYIDDPKTVQSMGDKLFPEGEILRHAVGQPAGKLAELAGIAVPEGTRLIVVKPDHPGEGCVWSREKMFPIMSAYMYETWEEAINIAIANLSVEGMGHSVSIHSNKEEHLDYAGKTLPVSRVLVNQICATQNGGAFMNGLNPTTTLGCGSWGNNSISENLFYTHLFNVTRVATIKTNWHQPSDEEIWG